jgi:RNA polymerase sigma-70 factor, ECF subfamily
MNRTDNKVGIEPALRDDLLAHVPRLRALAITLCRNVDRADDLVQETLVRALANIDSFERGTNLSAWLFTILRNLFRSQYRKRIREVDYDEESHVVKSAPTQLDRLQYEEFWRALWQLPAEHREILMLVVASDISYAEAAEICGCAVGTVKSRVNRARARLAALLGLEQRDFGPDAVTRAVLRPSGALYL